MISTSVECRRTRARRVLLSLTTILCSGLAVPALAQSAPLYRNLDANGVDLTLGDYVMAFKEGSIGSGGSELALVRQNNGNYPSQWDGYTLSQSVSGGVTTVVVGFPGQKADRFVGGNPNSVMGNGATLTIGTDPNQTFSYVYTAPDGTKVVFVNPWGTDGIPTNFCVSTGTLCSLVPATITRPNGASVTIAWRLWQLPANNFTWRMISVTSNYGYAVKFTYQSNALGGGLGGSGSSPPAGWFTRASSSFFNNQVSTTVPQATIGYTYPAADTVDITDMAGSVWEVTSTSVKRPGEASPSFSIGGTTGAVTSATRDGITTGYLRTVSGTTATMTVTDALSHTNVIVSDLTVGRPTSVTNALGKTTSYGYDAVGNLTSITQPEGNAVKYTLDARGNITNTKQTQKTGGIVGMVTSANYDATCANTVTCNQPNSVTDALGNETDYTYDPTHGGVTTVTLPAPTVGGVRPQTRYSYTLLNGVYRLTGTSTCQTSATCAGTADEVKTTLGYDANGNVSSVVRANGTGTLTATTASTYDGMGNLATVDGPLAGTADTTTYRYDADRRQVGAISADPDGAGPLKRRALKTTYDVAGRPTVVEVGTVNGTADTDWAAFVSAQQVTSSYTNNLKTKDVVSAGGTTYQVTQYSYDALGRSDCIALRMNAAIWGALPASACTPGTTGSTGPDQITRTSYDAAGRVTKTQSAYGTADQADDKTATYSDNGKLATLTDAQANMTTYEYDGYDRLVKTRYPVATAGAATSSTTDYEELVYDRNSNVTSRHLRGYSSDSTQHIDFTYDALNRVTLKDLPGSEPDVSYSYDNLNRLTSATTASNSVAIGYDALGRAVSQTTPLGTVAMAYDLAGNRVTTSWPDSFYVNYDHLVTGEVSAVRENGATSGIGVLATYGYDDLGNRTSITRGNGTTTGYGFDPLSRLSTLTHNLASTANNLSLGFSYTPASQIAGTTRSNDSYAWTGSADKNLAYGANGLNQLTTVGAGALGYDARGNLTSTGANAYTYSSENLLLTGPGATATYDPLMRLYQTTGTATLLYGYDGTQRIAEYNSSGTLQRRYVFGPGDDEPLVWYEGAGTSDRRWLHADERGSVVAVSNASGASIATNSYDEYGVPGSGNIGAFQYTGQAWLPDFGLYYYKARMYSSALGRFMQTDPIGYGAGMNWYGYVGGDPVNQIDPSGNASCGVGEYPVSVPSIHPSGSDGSGDTVVNGPHTVCARLAPTGEGGSTGTPGAGGGGTQGDVVVRARRLAQCHTDVILMNLIPLIADGAGIIPGLNDVASAGQASLGVISFLVSLISDDGPGVKSGAAGLSTVVADIAARGTPTITEQVGKAIPIIGNLISAVAFIHDVNETRKSWNECGS